jgi:hypothetical protein
MYVAKPCGTSLVHSFCVQLRGLCCVVLCCAGHSQSQHSFQKNDHTASYGCMHLLIEKHTGRITTCMMATLIAQLSLLPLHLHLSQ